MHDHHDVKAPPRIWHILGSAQFISSSASIATPLDRLAGFKRERQKGETFQRTSTNATQISGSGMSLPEGLPVSGGPPSDPESSKVPKFPPHFTSPRSQPLVWDYEVYADSAQFIRRIESVHVASGSGQH